MHPNIESFRGGKERREQTVFLRVARPKLTNAPKPPNVLLHWLTPAWQEWGEELETLSIRTLPTEAGEVTEVRFDESEERVNALSEYSQKRSEWIEAEKPARRTDSLYQKLFELWGVLRRESELLELVLANALLSLKRDDAVIQHPLLLASVQLAFDSSVPEFCLLDTGSAPEFYHMLFRHFPEWAGGLQNDIRAEFERIPIHPYDPLDDVFEWGNRTVHFLDKDGTAGRVLPNPPAETAEITEQPYLLLRSRSEGFGAALDAIVRDIDLAAKPVPEALKKMLGLTDTTAGDQENCSGAGSVDPRSGPSDPLFCLPANPQQLKVAEVIEQQRGVVVQGPPGTGKTHTIANLVGHFLAQGKSVLVTSHTTKALRVLRDKIPEEIRPLCVSVLDDDLKSREELKFAVNRIVGNLSFTQGNGRFAKAEECERLRTAKLQELAELRNEIRLGRSDEYRPITVSGREIDPSSAARSVSSGEKEHAWIPGPLKAGAPIPLSEQEVLELYASNQLALEDEQELDQWIPLPNTLPSPDRFTSTCQELEGIAALPKPSANFWPLDTPDTVKLASLQQKVQAAMEALSLDDHWILRVIQDSRDELSALPWRRLVEAVREFTKACLLFKEMDAAWGPVLSAEEDLEAQVQVLDEIETYLSQGKSLDGFFASMMHRKWGQYLDRVRVNARRPNTGDGVAALKAKARLLQQSAALGARWNRQVTTLGGPDSGSFSEAPEYLYRQWADRIESALLWVESFWQPLEEKMREEGVEWDKCLAIGPPVMQQCGDLVRMSAALQNHLVPEIEARQRRLRSIELYNELAAVAEFLQEQNSRIVDSATIGALIFSLRSRNQSLYRQSYERLEHLHGTLALFEKRRSLLQCLEAAAPGWAAQIRCRSGVHARLEVPGTSDSAWLWRQCQEELERRAKRSITTLQNEIAATTTEVEFATSKLIGTSAWNAQGRRMLMRPDAARALHFWMDALRKSRGTGQGAKYLRGEVRKQMGKCRESIPVWIMPLFRVVQNFDLCKSKFDVVIVDEASQSDLMGLMAVYMAEKVLVVGDDEQVSPDAVGQDVASVQDLIDSYLEGFPGARLFDRKYSLYDLAKANFGSPIRLREHFRCAPEIIQFSNALSYDFEIQALRDTSKCAIRPHVVPFKVDGVRGQSKVNAVEAETIASLICAMTEMPEYQDASIGVVSLLGDEQGPYIDRILRRRLSAEEYERRRIVCGNANQFQGDERKVILLSMVQGPADGPATLLSAGANDMNKKRFNVAASRAEDQMWVVYSLDPKTDLKDEDLRRRLIEHALSPTALLDRLQSQTKRVESEFERQVLARLVAAGYRVTSQFPVGSYRIDLVVEDGLKRLAVECDGDKFHGPEHLEQDMHRQELLERLGWTFVRIRGSEYFRNPEQALKSVFEKIASLGIQAKFGNDSPREPADALRDRVIRRAAAIRMGWTTPAEPQRDRDGGTQAAKPLSILPETAVSETAMPETANEAEPEFEFARRTAARKIEDVTTAEIRAAVLKVLAQGPLERNELLHRVKLALGFQRLRETIKMRIAAAIKVEIKSGKVNRNDKYFEVCQPSLAGEIQQALRL